jgi:large conductance mechanosensitive channel
MGILQEFKSFALRGNVIDLAVGIIMGAAFTGLVTALVNEVVTAPISSVAQVDFKDMYIGLWTQAKEQEALAAEKLTPVQAGRRYPLDQVKKAGLPYLGYGAFLTVLLNFLVVSFCVFLLVKGANHLARTANVRLGPAPAEAPPQEKLLAEIRDLLKARPLS